jgi:Ca-activated chloride channel family protein
MKKSMQTILLSLWVLQANLVFAHTSQPGRLKLSAAMGQPVMLANKKQVAYLRIGLTGFKLPTRQDRAPVNIAIVIDKSGSMGGDKIVKAKQAAIMAIDRLNCNDIISVVTYDSSVNVLLPATKVTDKEMIFHRIRDISAGGSTALYDGVNKGAKELRKFVCDNRVNRLVLLSDGLANVGPQTPTELGRLGACLIKDGISVTTIGLGLGYNEDLMTQLAYNSDGSHYFAESANELSGVFDSEFGRALSVVAQEIQIKIKCARGIRPIRLLGRQGQIEGQKVEVFINHLYSEHEKFIMLEVEVPETAKGHKRTIATYDVSYSNLKTHTSDRISSQVDVKFSNSKELIERRTNHDVMADVIELIATERNELALKLRDKGKMKQACELLLDNEAYLRDNAFRYDSQKLKKYAEQQLEDRDNMDEKNWTRGRKIMRRNQFYNKSQQGTK